MRHSNPEAPKARPVTADEEAQYDEYFERCDKANRIPLPIEDWLKQRKS